MIEGSRLTHQRNGLPALGLRRGAYVQHTTRFDDEMFDRIRDVAIRDGVNLSEAIRTLCEWGLEADAGDYRVTGARAEMTETCSRAVGMALKDAPQPIPVAAQIGRAAGAVIGAFMDHAEGKARRAQVKEECCALIALTLRMLHHGAKTTARPAAMTDASALSMIARPKVMPAHTQKLET